MTTKSRTVVVVEDDHSMSLAMARVLRLEGHTPITFQSAEELLDSGKGEGAMCMIIDVQLPGLSGFALRDLLAAAGRMPPVIFVTAFDDPDTRAFAARPGTSAFLAKPFSGQTLLEAVRRVAAEAS